MERDRVLKILREHQEELQAAGLLHLRLFGSVARGEDTAESDVDLLFDGKDHYSFRELMRWRDSLSGLLQSKVDLVDAVAVKPSIKAGVLMESLRAF